MHGRLSIDGYHGNRLRYMVHFSINTYIYAHEICLLPIGESNIPES